MNSPGRPIPFLFAVLAAPPAGGAAGVALVFSGVLSGIPALAAPNVRAPKEAPALPPKPALQPCLQPQGDPLSAQKIMQDLAAGRSVDLQGRIIDGSLD